MNSVREAVRALLKPVRWSPIGALPLVALLVAVGLLLYLGSQVQKIGGVILPTGAAAQSVPRPGPPPKSPAPAILILHSYHQGYTWTDNEMEGIRQALRDGAPSPRLFVEYLDCKRFPNGEHFERLRDLYRLKYAGQRIPVVLTTDNPAFEFALKYRHELFPDAALVFCGVNGYSPAMHQGHPHVTGVAEQVDAGATLRAALALHPGTRRVTVLHDYTVTGLASRGEAEAQLAPLRGRLHLDYLPDSTAEELVARLKDLPRDSLVLALSYSRDRNGRLFNHERISQLLSESSPVPVYATHEERLGWGVLGGHLVGGRLHGERAARKALEILGGRPADQVPLDTTGPSRLMFDHRQLARFGIPPSAVPPEAIVVNRPRSFVAEHINVVGPTLGIIAILFGGMTTLAVNVQRRRIAEEREKRLQVQLVQSQKMEAIGHLAGGVAHDFNNVLTVVLTCAELLDNRLPDGKSRELAREAGAAAERGAKLTRSLLAFSRKQRMEVRDLDLNAVVRDFEKLARRLISEDIELDVRLCAEPLVLPADQTCLEQVLLNLITNARDAMPAGGRIVVQTRRQQVDEGYRKAHLLERTGSYAALTVSDTGVGMDEATRERIFEPFFTTKEIGKGTGLGLSVVYGVVKQHRGSIRCDSAPGGGATFRILLPLGSSVAPAVAPAVARGEPGGGETLLLVEDEAAVRSIVGLVLRSAGYGVIEAKDGADAIEKFAQHDEHIDLVLCDVLMPRLNGKEAYAAMKGRRPDLPVLFMSGYSAEIIEERGLTDGRSPVLTKPVLPDQLLAKIREILG